jgi:Cys-tRNA(Pro) deacylase
MKATERVVAAANDAGLSIDPVEFPEGTRTAEDAARVVGSDVAQIVKSLVFVCDGEPVIAFVSGRHRLDPGKLARAAGARDARRATADEAKEATGYAIGGTPPIGHVRPLRSFLDPSLLAHEVVWCAGGTPSVVFAVAPDDLLKATGAMVVDLAEGERSQE